MLNNHFFSKVSSPPTRTPPSRSTITMNSISPPPLQSKVAFAVWGFGLSPSFYVIF